MMNILLIGSGGREHALAWKIAQSKRLNRLFIAPGNAGTVQVGTNAPIKVNDFEAIGRFALQQQIGMVVVGPEEPLVKGIVNYFCAHPELKHIPVIGPPAQGAQLEGSKDFAKAFMKRHRIPTAAYRSFTGEQEAEAQNFIRSLQPPYVLKADGLAAGKGVIIVGTHEEAFAALHDMFSGKFGSAGHKVVIEQFLSGIELSVFALTDGENYLILPEAKDYKRIGEGDTGPNTGGMGAVSPVPFAGKQFMEKVETRIVRPTVEGLRKDKIPYRGFIFFGLINVDGDPMVIEYNVRMGDPETEVVIPRLENDLLELLQSTADGTLDRQTIAVSPQTATTVMLVSGGYPGDYEKGKPIEGLEPSGDCMVFHAGTDARGGQTVTAGGRVLAVTAMADDMKTALAKSNAQAGNIAFEGKYFRRDIGFDLKTNHAEQIAEKSFFINEQNVSVYAGKIAAWIRERVEQAHRKGVTLGMSGGVDCSVTARLCQLAGVDAHLILMPYGDDMKNSNSHNHAMMLIEKFKFSYHIMNIKPAVDALLIPADSPYYNAAASCHDMSRVNLRPRVRMTYLYQFAQLDDRFVIGTGNLSERTVGYFTKWGDGACDLNPLAQLVKQEVYTLARYLEIPDCIIDKKPSAGLWDGQTDEDELGVAYAQIDAFITGGTSGNPETDRKIEAKRAASMHKRVPIPVFGG